MAVNTATVRHCGTREAIRFRPPATGVRYAARDHRREVGDPPQTLQHRFHLASQSGIRVGALQTAPRRQVQGCEAFSSNNISLRSSGMEEVLKKPSATLHEAQTLHALNRFLHPELAAVLRLQAGQHHERGTVVPAGWQSGNSAPTRLLQPVPRCR